jgi:hypothetical protein
MGYETLTAITEMQNAAGLLGINTGPFNFQYDTFVLVALSRDYFLGKWRPGIIDKIAKEVNEYRRKYPEGFSIEYDFSPVQVHRWIIKMAFKLALRDHAKYRPFDRLFLVRFTGAVFSRVARWQNRRLPKFARNQTMGIQMLLK